MIEQSLRQRISNKSHLMADSDRHLMSLAAAEIERLRKLVDRSREAIRDREAECDEREEAARWLHDKLTDHLDIGDAIDVEIEAKQRWPWLEDE